MKNFTKKSLKDCKPSGKKYKSVGTLLRYNTSKKFQKKYKDLLEKYPIEDNSGSATLEHDEIMREIENMM